MSSLFAKDEDLTRSGPVMGYAILRLLEESREARMSIFDVAEKLKRSHRASARAIYYGMLFLFSLGIIDFEEPYLVVKC